MAERPPHGWDISPEGYEAAAVPDLEWRMVTAPKRCRRQPVPRGKACGEQAVAETNRGGRMRANRRGATLDSWWAYCPEHLYGKWIEDGKVMHWILRRIPEVPREVREDEP